MPDKKGFRALFSKERWGVSSNFQVFMIFVVFSVTGSLSVHLAHIITHTIGLNQGTTSPWLFWPVRIALIFPLYQILLVIVGTLLGQHQFFWRYGQNMCRRMGIKF